MIRTDRLKGCGQSIGDEGSDSSRWQRAIRLFATVWPAEPDPPASVERALSFLGIGLDAATVLRACDGLGLTAGVVIAVVTVAVSGALAVGVLVGGVVGLAVATGARRLPGLLATARRTRALGAAPDLVSRAVLRMRLSPSPERAATFAAETSDGPLAASLARHARLADRSGESALASFGDEWSAWFPALRRAFVLVEAAASAPAGERERALDRALDVTLDGTRDRMSEFAGAVRAPTTAVYAFGVLVPMALVALLPAAGAAGLEVGLPLVIVGYDLLLPAGLVAASGWILARRPVAFPSPRVGTEHPDVPDRKWPRTLLGLLAGAVAWPVATAVGPAWSGPLAAVGVGTGVALVARFRPARSVQQRVRAVERGLADALYLVGREVERGRSVEAALAEAADEIGGATGDVLADATRVQRQLRVGPRAAFLGEHGALATIPSERARSVASLIAVAAEEGRPAGRAIVAMAEHVDDLQRVERTTRQELRRVTATLSHTAAVFGPLVGGATVALARQMTGDGPLTGNGLPPAGLGLAVGGYVLLLTVILTALVVGLERGFDRALVGYRVGLALLSATCSYLLAVGATGLLV